MSSANQFDWAVFYEELAEKLLPYKENRQELITKVFQIYEITGINMPPLERDNQIVDIDPFTFFGMFNKGLVMENRINLISTIADLFGVVAPVPTSFDGIPVLVPLNAKFYQYEGERGENDIDILWELFESALTYADTPTSENRTTLSSYFDLAVNMKFNGRGKITMGLYWIASDTFLNLDGRNVWYIYESGKLPGELVQSLPKISNKMSADKYFEVLEKIRAYLQSDESPFKNFKELSFEAWRYSEEVDERKKQKNISSAYII